MTAGSAPGHLVVSALQAAPASQALGRWPGALRLAFDAEVDPRAARIVTAAPAAPEPGQAGLRLGDEDLDIERPPDLAAVLAGAPGTPGLRQRRLDTWLAPGLALSARVDGLVIGENAARVAAILKGGASWLQAQRPWLVLAVVPAEAAALDATLAAAGYGWLPPDDAPAPARWRAALAAGDTRHAGQARACLRQLHEAAGAGTIDPGAGLWGWGLQATPYPQRDYPLRITPRGACGLVLPGAGWRLRLRRDDAGQPLPAPRVLVDGRPVAAELDWQGRDGVLAIASPGHAAPVRTLELSWGSSALLARSFSGESPLSLGAIDLLAEG